METLEKIVGNPWLNILIGLILVISSGMEIKDSMQEATEGLKTHHGVFLFGVLHILKLLPDLFDGAERIQEGSE
ncbi:hypothetical protein ACQZV8_20110 [Magnetococcales bacterium HHB-1]